MRFFKINDICMVAADRVVQVHGSKIGEPYIEEGNVIVIILDNGARIEVDVPEGKTQAEYLEHVCNLISEFMK